VPRSEGRAKRVGRACLIAGHVRAKSIPSLQDAARAQNFSNSACPVAHCSVARHGQDTHAASEFPFHPTDMAPRASSPALSENEFDIFDALAGGDGAEQQMRLTADLGLDLGIASDDGSDDEAFIAAKQAAANRKNANAPGKPGKKGGGFQAMGLNAALLKAIAQKGFKIPTPIQRKAVPLMLQGDDVVGMARTGSGKTAAFVIPMIEKLKTHSAKVGARGVIMSPSRELALQTLKVVKELGRGTDLRTILLVGGDSLEERSYSIVHDLFG
jgi:ATP-dependent RNA helicase DDX54/DBP10